MPKKFPLIILLLLLWSCTPSYRITSREAAQRHISPAALKYFHDAFSIIQEKSYKKKTTDFKQLYHTAAKQLDSAQSYAATYPTIRALLAGLKDNHSFFQAPRADGQSLIALFSARQNIIPFSTEIKDGYGIIALHSYNSLNKGDQHRIADSIYTILQNMAQQQVRGIIIDLRKMEGGTTLPFLCGFGLLINQETLLRYTASNGKQTSITWYKNGIYTKNKRKTTRLTYLTRYQPLALSNTPIALITGRYTASAGEMILISFLGLPRVKTFGEPTLGVATGKDNIFLADSAFISLATTVTCDRSNRAYPGPVIPDEQLDLQNAGTDELINAVKAWMP